MDGNKLNLAIESFDQNIELGNMLHQNIRRGQVLSASMYRILNLELKQTTKRSSVPFDPLPKQKTLLLRSRGLSWGTTYLKTSKDTGGKNIFLSRAIPARHKANLS